MEQKNILMVLFIQVNFIMVINMEEDNLFIVMVVFIKEILLKIYIVDMVN